ncbi:Transcriptional regulatory protein TdiR [Paraburkholderia hiiakae]|uniref:Transcriptional regulatory protein TdiR n=1 Tax=Paraburkholderia hiiakae TaxID=1081782 RepID=A0ABN7I825_9BURK|nr:response regulator [Paraburkholderia hiiakae]CAD6552182.1 Transcriptional regulatory protein TdiR [Paraburkholderia hiiakae]
MNVKRQMIVIVEDDAGLRRALERLLRYSGFRTRSFRSAEDANLFEFASTARCLVIDVQLPGISGPAFYDTLHAPRPPAVFMSAYDGARTRGAIVGTGAHALLTKPFPGAALVEAIFKATASA